MISAARKASSASTELTWAFCGIELTLVQVILDALSLSQQIRRVLIGNLDEFLHRLHHRLELLGELRVFLVLPGVAERGESRLERNEPILQVGAEPFQFIGETPHLFGIHYG